MFQKLKQYKDLRSQAKTMQDALSQVTVHGSSTGEKINVVMDGNQKILSLDIDVSLLSPDNKTKLEKGIPEAIAAALKKLQQEMLMKMKKGELEMPDISSLT